MPASAMPLNVVQRLNYNNLATVRDAARSDPAGACCRYGLSRELLDALSQLTPEKVMSLVAHMGDEALFVPRDDLGSLLAAPESVAPLLAASHARKPQR